MVCKAVWNQGVGVRELVAQEGRVLITKRQNNSTKKERKKERIRENFKSTNKADQKSSLRFAIIMNQQA